MKKRPDGVSIISIYHLLTGALWLLLACGLLTIPLIVAAGTAGDRDSGTATAITGMIMLFIAGLLVLLALANLIVGWGLWRLRDWARLSAIALSILGLFAFPIGTLIGGVTIWYLLTPDVVATFQGPEQVPTERLKTNAHNANSLRR